MVNRFFSLGLILLLLTGCSSLGKVKLYEGAPLPDSEISVLREMSGLEEQHEGRNLSYFVWNLTYQVDGKHADGEAAPGYLNYSRKEKRWLPLRTANIDYHLKPGAHTLVTIIGSSVLLTEGPRYGSTECVKAKYCLAYDFKKGCRYQIGAHFKTIERTAESRIMYTCTVWLQQVNADGSVVDVAQFAKID